MSIFTTPNAYIERIISTLYNIDLTEHELLGLLEQVVFAKTALLKRLDRLDAEDDEVLTRMKPNWLQIGEEILAKFGKNEKEVDDSDRLKMFIIEQSIYDFILERMIQHEMAYDEILDELLVSDSIFTTLFGKFDRNDLCYCGSGKKYKKCCINDIEAH